MVALFAAACGSNESASASTNVEAADSPTAVTGSTPNANASGQTTLADGAPVDQTDLSTKPPAVLPSDNVTDLIIEDIIVGDGDEAMAGMEVEVQYVGVLACTGAEFDASWDRGTPFTFTLGASQVIYGWDAGVDGMRVGGRRQLTIPSQMGYGERGSGSGIPPGADLVFVVDLLSVAETDQELPPREVPAPEVSAPEVEGKPTPTLPSGPITTLQTEDIVTGDGAPATAGSLVEVNYVGVLACNGQEFDASWNRGETFTFALGSNQVIPGWDEGVAGMAVGGQRQLTIPSDLAYGATGSGPIPGGADLVFVVDLLSITEAASPEDQPEYVIPTAFSGELEMIDILIGDGPPISEGQQVSVHFAVSGAASGEELSSTWKSGGAPVQFRMDETSLPGIVQGMIGMNEGGIRQIVIPPELAFGEEGQEQLGVLPSETLIAIVEAVSVPSS